MKKSGFDNQLLNKEKLKKITNMQEKITFKEIILQKLLSNSFSFRQKLIRKLTF